MVKRGCEKPRVTFWLDVKGRRAPLLDSARARDSHLLRWDRSRRYTRRRRGRVYVVAHEHTVPREKKLDRPLYRVARETGTRGAPGVDRARGKPEAIQAGTFPPPPRGLMSRDERGLSFSSRSGVVGRNRSEKKPMKKRARWRRRQTRGG